MQLLFNFLPEFHSKFLLEPFLFVPFASMFQSDLRTIFTYDAFVST